MWGTMETLFASVDTWGMLLYNRDYFCRGCLVVVSRLLYLFGRYENCLSLTLGQDIFYLVLPNQILYFGDRSNSPGEYFWDCLTILIFIRHIF